jgi:pre-mRNA-splicing helicase BRR2
VLQVIKRCADAGVESVYDIIDLEDENRTQLLQMSNQQMLVFHTSQLLSLVSQVNRKDVAAFVNSYPTLELNYDLIKAD